MKAILLLVFCSLPSAFTSSLGLKGHREGPEHAAVEVGLHQQERCHQEYDEVWEEKCATVYEDKCTVQFK